jgi:hypothetical protein
MLTRSKSLILSGIHNRLSNLMKTSEIETVETVTADTIRKMQTQIEALAAKIAILESALVNAVEQIKPSK